MAQHDKATGYDGQSYKVGDRIEIHPGTDLWMMGARYGIVVGMIPTKEDRIRVKLDKLPDRRFSGPEDRFRKIT